MSTIFDDFLEFLITGRKLFDLFSLAPVKTNPKALHVPFK